MRTGREVGIFVHRDGQVLLMRRTRDGIWHIPAGVVEEGESYREAAARELAEETGLRSSSPLRDLGCPQSHEPAAHERHTYPAGMDRVLYESFAVEAPTGWEPRLDAEHTEHRWCAFDDAAGQFHWENTREAFAALRRALVRPDPPDFDPQVRSALDEAKNLIAAGDIPGAIATYEREWDALVARGDHFHACVVAHMAGVAEPHPAKKHEWNLVALREADAVPETIRSRGLYASLYNNLGMSHSVNGRRAEARHAFEMASAHLDEIPAGPYADQVRAGIERNVARLRTGPETGPTT